MANRILEEERWLLCAHPLDQIWRWITETFGVLQVQIFVGVFFLLFSSCSGNAVSDSVRCPVLSRGFFSLNDTASGNLSHQTGEIVTPGPPE